MHAVRCSIFAILVALSWAACGASTADKTPATPVTKVPGEQGEPVSDEGKSWGGWRWKGKRDDCFFVHRNRCFAELRAACQAARCPLEKCIHDDAAPANISCKK